MMLRLLLEATVAVSFGCFSTYVIYRYALWELGELAEDFPEG